MAAISYTGNKEKAKGSGRKGSSEEEKDAAKRDESKTSAGTSGGGATGFISDLLSKLKLSGSSTSTEKVSYSQFKTQRITTYGTRYFSISMRTSSPGGLHVAHYVGWIAR